MSGLVGGVGAERSCARSACLASPTATHALPSLQALEVLTRAYGLHDARVAFALHNLGGFYLTQRRLEQAAECYEQALKMKLEVLGTGHRCGGRYSLSVSVYCEGGA